MSQKRRVMALAFAIGSACFLLGPISAYATLVGERGDALTFFLGSIFFTVGGGLQTAIAAADRHGTHDQVAAWRTATIQSLGTLFFNVSTFRALQTAFSNEHYDKLVWRPDAFGSICFLVSGAIAYSAARSDWPTKINLLGCIFFGVSAIAGYVRPETNTMIAATVANVTTSLGAACFLACALVALRPAMADQ